MIIHLDSSIFGQKLLFYSYESTAVLLTNTTRLPYMMYIFCGNSNYMEILNNNLLIISYNRGLLRIITGLFTPIVRYLLHTLVEIQLQ
jgi:hypothetical protein